MTSVVLAMVVVVALGLATYWVIPRQVEKYTAETATPLPEVQYDEEEMARLQQRLQTLTSNDDSQEFDPPARGNPQVDKPEVDKPEVPAELEEASSDDEHAERAAVLPGDLVLTTHDINALINRHPKFRGRAFVTIQDGKVGGQISVPLEKLPGGEGRFFNATAEFDVALVDGKLVVNVTDATVKNAEVPRVLVKAIGSENLARELNEEPRLMNRLRRFESLSVEDDKLILRRKR